MKKEYFLGLDMGTSSVGWAVTDDKYELLKFKGKDLWGIREFEEAQTAVERRTHRTSRRRRQREKVRIGLLKFYFEDAINKVDPLFYQRLDNSKYHFEDKDIKDKNNIFNDDNYSDKDYFEQYPTIYHLRKELIENESEHDVRLVYLALLNMFKHRGHFLNSGLTDEASGRDIKEVYVEFCNMCLEELNINFDSNLNGQLLEDILSDRNCSRTEKKERISRTLGFTSKEKRELEIIKVICGLKANAKIIFEDLETEDNKKIDICFSEFGYDEKIPEIREILGDKYFSVIELAKEIYDIGSLAGIMKGYNYLSQSRVEEYNKHKYDLCILKKIIKKYKSKEEYDFMFRTDNAGTYSSYVNSYNSDSKIRRGMGERKIEGLYKTIKKLIKDLSVDDPDIKYIIGEMEKETFLPKQLTASNGIIPNQVHLMEMKAILNNAEKYLPFLQGIDDESGLTVAQRIVELFKFQIPYYIGPTSENSDNGWVVRKEKGLVLPWNIDKKIDMKKSSEEFISKMVRRCSYLNDEKVLPKASLEYESFCVLNEINNICINGQRISVELKQEIYKLLFEKGKKVTRKQLAQFLISKGLIEDDTQISGIDITINNSLSTYGKFKAIVGEKIDEDAYKNMVEKIVFWCTVYGDSKKFLLERIKESYSDKLDDAQIKRILGLKFKDWGNLSKEFLELSGCEKTIGENISLIRMMWETNYNLMELLNNDKYTYGDNLAGKQVRLLKTLSDLRPEDLDEYYFSAPVKRMLWQTLLIINELEGVLGCPPKRVFIEMIRKPDEKKQRTVSRKQKFLELYKRESAEWKKFIENADNNGTLKSKKMYLYLTQKGRCMYTGEIINLDELFSDNLYDIDHIYPRHYVKDDNIDNNLVLVKKQVNAHKSDTYPLEEAIYQSQIAMWKELLRANLITEEKYNRLTGRSKFTDEQKAGFIARQLVETSQGTKGIAEVLKQVMPETKIVYSKASNVADFRNSRKLYKSRLVNEFHHAHDAYLNIVVGNVYFVKFTQNPLNFIKKEYLTNKKENEYNLSKMFDCDVIRNGEVAWIGSKKGEEEGTIVTVKRVLAKNTPLMSRRSFEARGGIANETLYSARKCKEEGYIPLKETDSKLQDVTKYGGFTSVSTAYYFLVEHDVKKKRIRTIEAVPIYLKEKVGKEEDKLLKYCVENLGLVNPSIRMRKIKIQSLVKRNGFYMYISGKTGNQLAVRNAVNLCIKQEWIKYIKQIEKSLESNIVSSSISKEKNAEIYFELREKFINGIYSKRPNPVGEKLENGFQKFESLNEMKQCRVISQILNLTAIGMQTADLTLLGEAAICGKMLIAKKISDAEEFVLINQSVTGIYEKRINLLTV